MTNCDNKTSSICDYTDYPNWESSDYVLPYPVGVTYTAIQGNCSEPDGHWHWNSHTEGSPWTYAYDFLIPVGNMIVASRGGEVVWLREENFDDDYGLGKENAVIIKHNDQTFAAYSHLTHQGVLVEVGQLVEIGDTIAISGNSGLSSIPHLHFQVSPCLDAQSCGSLPMTFRNTRSNEYGLIGGEDYPAYAY